MAILKKKIDKYKCKWMGDGANWEWQECNNPKVLNGMRPMDVSCRHQPQSGHNVGKDCEYFEER